MIHLTIPNHDFRPLPFYLAMEQYVATNLPEGEYFFTWVVNPTVIAGRNQDVFSEIDLNYCNNNNIDVVRRKSGGGCVYADRSNIMVSYIAPALDDVPTTFARYTEAVAAALRSMGLDATASGRNDVCIGSDKVSGNAFYHIPGRSIMHGTMLYDINPTHMSRAITPSRAKLMSKGVKSVQSRVTTIKTHRPDLSMHEFRALLTRSLADTEMVLDQTQIAAIEEMAKEYRKEGWFEGRRSSHKNSHINRREIYVPGMGTLQLNATTDDNGLIDNVWISGDYLRDINEAPVRQSLLGKKSSQTILDKALETLTTPNNIII